MTARRRGCLLGALQQAHRAAPGQTVALDVLHKYLLAIGLRPTLHQVQLDIEWLVDQSLAEVTRLDDTVFARISRHGQEAAARRVTVAGLDVSELGD
ncbi:hypothetical protein [Limnohabitans sp.]|uniref:hypothetical protein n=1 Tax=Limnohabitans sp. TaxID=1907725 RepID=UPI00286F0D42|nr:hypothetical protein [Limnohabitans sp.]